MMVQPADFWQLHDRTQLWWLYEPRVGRVHIERSMDAPRMIVVHVGSKHTVEMPLVEHDDMIGSVLKVEMTILDRQSKGIAIDE
jgi:hypothetical protein